MKKNEVLLVFETEKQADSFYRWFLKHGFDDLVKKTRSDIECLSASERPSQSCNTYYLEIQ